jgi:glutamate synthase domain-containing protein 3
MINVDIESVGVREFNQRLHALPVDTSETDWKVINPYGAHAIAVGLTQPLNIEIEGHVGYYCAGMNKEATVTVDGNVGTGFAENIMSGLAHAKGNASQAAGATGHGGTVIIDGDASSRCGTSMKGVDIVVGGSVGHMAVFLGQTGHLLVCGDAGAHLGDSLYEAIIFVRGEVESLGSDCIEKEMTPSHLEKVAELLAIAKFDADPKDFRRYGSARNLYNIKIDNAGSY